MVKNDCSICLPDINLIKKWIKLAEHNFKVKDLRLLALSLYEEKKEKVNDRDLEKFFKLEKIDWQKYLYSSLSQVKTDQENLLLQKEWWFTCLYEALSIKPEIYEIIKNYFLLNGSIIDLLCIGAFSQVYVLYISKQSKLNYVINNFYNILENSLTIKYIFIFVDEEAELNCTLDIKYFNKFNNVIFKAVNVILMNKAIMDIVIDYDSESTIFSSFTSILKPKSKLNMVFANSNVKNSFHEIRYKLEEDSTVKHVDIASIKKEAKYSIYITQEHNGINSTSNVISKVILKDQASAFYRGNIIIENKANNSNASLKQLSLILSEKARSCAIPSLQVKHNEVKCSHGAATGKMDENQLWYLQSRGLDVKNAYNLIIEAFFCQSDMINTKEKKQILNRLRSYIE